jgi:MFS transporter, DHA1 family, tetracycline resistance protein
LKNRSKSIIFIVILIDLLGFGIIIPIIPTLASKVFNATDFEIGLVIASFSFAQFIFSSIWGRLSDEIGRKPVIIISMSGNILAYLLFAWSHNLFLLFVSRLLAGACAGSISAAQAYMSDVSSHKERAKSMALIGMAFSLGFVLGPFIGGVLSKHGYELPGYFAAFLSLAALISTIIWLKESLDKTKVKQQVKRKFNLSNLADALKHPNIGILLIMYTLLITAISILYSILALFLYKNFGFSEQSNGYVFAFIGFIGAIAQGTIGLMTKKFPERKILLWGNLLAAIGITLLAFSSNILMLVFFLAFYALGSGIGQTIIPSLISQSVEPEEQGGTLGLNQSLGSLARVLGPILGGLIFETFGHTFPFIIAGLIVFIVFVMSFYTRKIYNE